MAVAVGSDSMSSLLIGALPDGLCLFDACGRILFVNPAGARLLGAEAGMLTGKGLHTLLHGEGESAPECGEECPLRRAIGRGVAACGEESFLRADGDAFPAEFSVTPLSGPDAFSGFALSFRDITRRLAKDRIKDEFISTVSHELRTPLTSIRGALGLLSSGILGELDDRASNLLRIALTNSDRLVRLINDILDLERIQSGREPLNFLPVQLGEIVCQAIDGIQPMADEAQVAVRCDDNPVQIEADPDRLMQVVTNLLSNAVKFSPAGGEVRITLQTGADGVTLSVIDEGRGIPAEMLESIFGRFQQVDAGDARQKGGTGLGLAICRGIVVQHSGRIWAECNPERGATFRVFLPYQPNH